MAVSKAGQITALALEVLEDAEMSRSSVESLILKASRLARLVDDEEAIKWLEYERLGYKADENISLKYLHLTRRWIKFKEMKAHWGSTAVQEATVAAAQQQLDAAKSFQPANVGPYRLQLQEIARISESMKAASVILSAVRAQVQQFATRIYHEKLFSHQAETIFAQYQGEVDARLAVTAQTAFDRLPHAFERLAAGDKEAVSHALTTCRRVLDSFGDSVYPPRAEPARIGEKELQVGAPDTRNRLRVYVYEQIGKGSRYERLSRAIASLYDRVSAGIHADVTIGEARALVLHTYLLLGEILTFPTINS
jgi:hypothetical protein